MTAKEFNACVEAYADGVFRFIVKNLKDQEMARDVVQDSFERLWLRVGELDPAKAKSYLFTTAYHRMVDYLRKEKRQSPLEPAHENRQADTGHYTDLAPLLEQALAQLPPAQRSVVMLRDYEGYSYKEIGQVTGLSEAQVKVYIYRARVFLKNHIGSIEAVL